MQYMRKITTCVFSQGHQVLPKWDIKELYSCRCGVVVSAHDAHADGAGLYPDAKRNVAHVNRFRRLS